jgi:two-component system nitrate/nitrite response regulator NarL
MTDETIHIAIADDHRIFLEGLQLLLEKEDNIKIVGTAINGQEVLKILDTSTVDITIIDINMPGMNGIDAVALIRKKHPKVKVIMLTSYNDKHLINKLLKGGANGYVLKDMDKNELHLAIETVMSGETYISKKALKTIEGSKNESTTANDFDNYTKGASLTNREIQILKLVAKGQSNQQIADELFVSYHTVKTHRKNLLRKLEVNSVVDLVKIADAMNLD